MPASKKRRKIALTCMANQRHVDRLSDLPDCLLHDILSRLKARQLVHTCVLSSRWCHLWLSAPCLDIDARDLTSVARQFNWENDEELDRMDDFVDSLLLHRAACASPLDSLRLSVPPSLRHDHVYRSCCSYTWWVRRGLRCSPETLDVSGIKLPPLASGSGTHRLTKLRLHQVCLHDDFEKHLSSGLPVLQDLEIRGTDMSNISRIASHTLKNLIVDNSHTSNKGAGLEFLIDAPRLASLHLVVQFQGLGLFDVTLCEAASPIQASIQFLDTSRHCWQDEGDILTTICTLLRSLSNVTRLELSGFMALWEQQIPAGTPFPVGVYRTTAWTRAMLQAIIDEKEIKLPQFLNLKTLVLDKCEIGDNIQTLWSFLRNTPALEKLILNNCGCQKFSYAAASNIFEMGYITANLKLVEIKYSHGDDHQGQDTPQMEKILSMVRRDLPVPTKINVTKVEK